MNKIGKYDHQKRPLGAPKSLKMPICKGFAIIEWE